MKRLKISKLLNYLFVSFFVLILFFISYSIYLSNNLSNISSRIYYHPFAVTNEIKNIKIDIKNIEYILDNVNITKENDLKNEFDKVNMYENQIENSISFIHDRFFGDKEMVNDCKNNFDDYRNSIRGIIIKKINNSNDSSYLSRELKANLLINSINLLYQGSLNNANKFYNQIDNEHTKMTYSSVIFVAISFTYGMFFLFIVNAKVKKPIDNINQRIEMLLLNDNSINQKEILLKNEIELLIFTIEYLEKLKSKLTEVIEKNKITEKELLDLNEILRNTMYSKERLFSIIAHDLINPFNAIIGFTQLLKNELDSMKSEEVKKLLENISQSAINQHSLLRNLLDWSRTQLNEIKIKKEMFNVNRCVIEIIETLKLVSDSKNVEIINKTDLRQHIYSDKKMLMIILNNIISNAIKYSYQNGKIIIKSKEEKIYVTLEIKDFGTGIRKEKTEDIFDMKLKIIETGTKGEKGSGLGLLVCKEFIDKLGGRIWVESEIGKGSTFFISLPKEMYKEIKLTF